MKEKDLPLSHNDITGEEERSDNYIALTPRATTSATAKYWALRA